MLPGKRAVVGAAAMNWLPYRLRKALDQSRIHGALRGLKDTLAMEAASAGEAAAELHMLLCQRDLHVGLLAIKSLLHFTEGKLAVALTDDGSLTQDQRQWVSDHVVGAHWYQRKEKKVSDSLAGKPHLKKLYDSDYAPAAKLLHPMLLARCGRVIVLDPDTAFFDKPTRLLDWAHYEQEGNLYLHDHQDETAAVPEIVEKAFEQLQQQLMDHGKDWSVKKRLFNSGLLAIAPRSLSLDIAERYLAWRETAPQAYRQGKAAIWFGDWTPEQTCYHVMFALGEIKAVPLGDDYHLGGGQGYLFNHFLRHYLVQTPTLKRLRALTAKL